MLSLHDCDMYLEPALRVLGAGLAICLGPQAWRDPELQKKGPPRFRLHALATE